MINANFSKTTVFQDAVRILFILHFCNDQPNPTLDLDLPVNQRFVAYIDSETKLQKIDFWIRYPDYLCAALLWACEHQGRALHSQRNEIKEVIRSIFDSNEPEIRLVPMYKYLRGAYERLDGVMTFLSSRDLAIRRPTKTKHKTRYFLTEKGGSAVQGILKECPTSHWYQDRCQLINRYFGHWNGFEIRESQYRERTYQETPNLKLIEQIDDEVRERFERQFGEEL